MKKLFAFVLTLCALGLIGCGNGESHKIEFLIPAGSTHEIVYAAEEISPKGNHLMISAGAGIVSTEVVLVPIDGAEEDILVSMALKQREPVKVKVEKGVWYRIGIAEQNLEAVPTAAEIVVENADVRSGN